jgi:outer membrane protein TolC
VVFFTSATHAVTLEDAIESALKVDPSLRASKFNVLATGENIAIARSRLLPQVSLQGSSNQLTQTTSQVLASGGNSSRSFTGPSVNHQFVIRQALLRPKEMSALRFAELQSQYMELKFKSDVKDLQNRVINAWIDVLAAQHLAQAYERPLDLMRKASMQERARYAEGESTKDASMEAVAQYENSIAIHNQAVETLKAKQSAFENLTKIPAAALLGKTLDFGTLPVLSEMDKVVLWLDFQESSIELQMAKLQENIQLERMKMAEADGKPTLDLLATINFAQNDATSTQGYQYRNKQLGIQYTWPLFAGGGNVATERQANLVYAASISESDAQMLKLDNEFKNAWSQVAVSPARQKALINLYESVMEQYKAVERGGDLGVKLISEISSVESNRLRRYVDLVNNIQDYYRNKLKVDRTGLLKILNAK